MISDIIRNDIEVRRVFETLANAQVAYKQDKYAANAFYVVYESREAVLRVLVKPPLTVSANVLGISIAFDALAVADEAFKASPKTLHDWNKVLEARQAVFEAVTARSVAGRQKQLAVRREADAGASAGPAPKRARTDAFVDLSEEPDDE